LVLLLRRIRSPIPPILFRILAERMHASSGANSSRVTCCCYSRLVRHADYWSRTGLACSLACSRTHVHAHLPCMHACLASLSRLLPVRLPRSYGCTFAALPAQPTLRSPLSSSAPLTRGVQDPAKRHALPACLLAAVPGLFGGLRGLVCFRRGGAVGGLIKWARVFDRIAS
jgi:hypothetical protein